MSNLKVQIKHKVQMPEAKEPNIKTFVIRLTFGFWHLTFAVNWRSTAWAMINEKAPDDNL
jgi:hypothetical protein